MTVAIDVVEHEGAVTVRVRVKPRSSRARVGGTREGALEVAVTAPPVDGAANEAVVAVIASALGVPKRDVAIVRGASSRDKTVRIVGATAEQVRALAAG